MLDAYMPKEAKCHVELLSNQPIRVRIHIRESIQGFFKDTQDHVSASSNTKHKV